MTSAQGPSSGAEGIVPQIAYTPAAKAGRKDFKAWHKPRKQLVRRIQWLQEVEHVLNERIDNIGMPFRYLTLPGVDLLDVRFLHQAVFVPRQQQLHFLGFDRAARPQDSAQTDFNVSLDEVMRLPYVDPESTVRPEDIRVLANNSSTAWQEAIRTGAYDVINLDLCSEFLHEDPAIDGTLYNAVKCLFGLQARRLSPWSMLLTMRVGTEGISAEAQNLLANHLSELSKACPDLLRAVNESFSCDTAAALGLGLGGEDPALVFQMNVLLVSLWVARQAAGANCQMRIASCLRYTVWGAAPYCDMLSIVFRFLPQIASPADPTSLARNRAEIVDLCGMVDALPRRIAASEDIDQRLAGDYELWISLVDETAELLREARYDAEEFRKWAAAA